MWHDRRITGGQEWKDEIDEHLETAEIILLLVSADFIASDYCMDVELTRAMDRHEAGEARIVPIILRACQWQSQQFGKLQALPNNGIPIVRHPRGPDQAFLEIEQGITGIVNELCDSDERTFGRLPDPKETILAHLCNRKDQDDQLQADWEKHRASGKWRRPFVCIVHGPADADHSGYLNRLLSYTLPKIIGMDKGSIITPYHRMEWPKDCASREAALNYIAHNLGRTLGVSADARSIGGRLRSLARPTLICSDLLTSYPNYGHKDVIEAFFEFWNTLPDLGFGQALFVVLFVSYQPGHQKASAQQLFDVADCLWNLSIVLTKELPSITAADVREWRSHEEVQRFCQVQENQQAWDADIDRTFEHGVRIPMEQLTGTLNRMLANYQRR